MIGITQYFHHTDTTEEVKDKVRLVFPIFIISISFCILLNKDGYIVAVFSFFVAIVLITVLYYVMKDFYTKIKDVTIGILFWGNVKFHIPYFI